MTTELVDYPTILAASDAITKFSGMFLSNFWGCSIYYDGAWYPSVEHAYQAAKTLSDVQRAQIRTCRTAGQAKALGRRVELRPGWDDMKLALMYEFLCQKFGHPSFETLLAGTAQRQLIEGNTWNDRYWGACYALVDGVGQWRGHNYLGQLLMDIRGTLS